MLDANILIRAVLGNRVRRILEKYADSVSFFIPEYAYAEAEEHLTALVSNLHGDYEVEARRRLGTSDPEDWPRPILASALALACPIWTAHADFFECGVATCTSNRVEIFLGD